MAPPPGTRTTPDPDDHHAIDGVKERLAVRFPERSADEIAAVVDEIHGGMANAKVKDFVPVLVEKTAKKRLKSS